MVSTSGDVSLQKGQKTRKRAMRKYPIFRQVLSATAAVVVVALGFMTTAAMAGSSTHEARKQLAHAAANPTAQHRRHVARREFARGFGDEAYAAASQQSPAYREPSYSYMPGYAYAPGKGMVDEACNLPTSACPNEMRDGQ
jgi:hypothetical protein